VTLLLLLLASQPELGRLSTYRPGPGLEELACGGRYTRSQVHVAHRRWRELGCGRLVLVCAEQTGRCAVAPVMDSGPWGIRKGKAWRLRVGTGLPKGWRWSSLIDLSWALWRQLGRPHGRIALYIDRSEDRGWSGQDRAGPVLVGRGRARPGLARQGTARQGALHEVHILRHNLLAIPSEGASMPGMVRGVLALLGGFAQAREGL
jgi:hypothetical protein